MKYFTKQVNEKLKLSKDTKIIINTNEINIDDIDKDDSFKCITIKPHNNYALNFTVFENYDLICEEKPFLVDDNYYQIYVHWATINNTTMSSFNLYYYPKIQSQFLIFDYENMEGLFVLFKNSNEAQKFLDNYNSLYKKKIIAYGEELIKIIKK